MKKIIILLTVLTITGCATSEPKMYDLLHREGAKNLVYKSITIEDYKGEDYNQRSYLNLYEGISISR